MAYDGWLEFNGAEIVNLSRTAQLSASLGIESVWISGATIEWIEAALGGVNYGVVTSAPWYDAAYPASTEFAGIVPLAFPGLDDSTTQAETTEYIGNGGRSGNQRNGTLSIVASVAIVASTDRGAEYGKRWLDRTLRAAAGLTNSAGSVLRYFRFPAADAPVAHRRKVRLTRGVSVTRKRSVEQSSTWLATFTLTCDDSYEYGDPVSVLTDLGGWSAPSGAVLGSGELALNQTDCPVWDYTPVYDPLYPALVSSPTAPDLYPTGWTITEGMTFDRFWARVSPVQPSSLNVVPLIELSTDVDARMVRVSIWPSSSATDDQCDPLFSAVVSYLPSGTPFYIDGEQQASYVWDGAAPVVRRTDSLVYSPDARPVEWTAFNDPTSLLVTIDLFTEGSGVEGGGDVRMALSLIPKSD